MRRADVLIATLRTQYRMHPAIGNLISKVFYDGALENGVSKDVRRRLADWLPGVVTWLSTSGSLPNRAEARRGESYENASEVETIMRLLTKLETKSEGERERVAVGIITGYSAQVDRLRLPVSTSMVMDGGGD